MSSISTRVLLRLLSDRIRPSEVFHVPQDAADFGRCVRMLELFPEYAEVFPQCTLPISEWEKL